MKEFMEIERPKEIEKKLKKLKDHDQQVKRVTEISNSIVEENSNQVQQKIKLKEQTLNEVLIKQSFFSFKKLKRLKDE